MDDLIKKAQSKQLKDNVIYMQMLIDNIKDSLLIIDEVLNSELNFENKESRKLSQTFWMINCIKSYLDLNKQFNNLQIPNQKDSFLSEFVEKKNKRFKRFFKSSFE